jgi:hypothetical protein
MYHKNKNELINFGLPVLASFRYRKILYWVPMSLFCLLFFVSVIWSLLDIQGTVNENLQLGYPGFIVAPLAIAKLLGIVAILSNKSRTLTMFAFAGFLYDLLLATLGHYHNPNIGTGIGVAIFGLFLWILAFMVDQFGWC